MTNLIIVGAGGFGLEVAAYAADIAKYQAGASSPFGFLDDTKSVGTVHAGLPVLGGTDTPIDSGAHYALAIGDPAGRKAVADKLAAQGARFATLLHPAAYVADTSLIGEGSLLAPFSFAGAACKIGRLVLLNIYASVAHESTAGDFCTLAPYAGTHALAALDEGCFLGAHAAVTRGVCMGAGSKLAAGSIAYTDIPAEANAIGNPARFKSS